MWGRSAKQQDENTEMRMKFKPGNIRKQATPKRNQSIGKQQFNRTLPNFNSIDSVPPLLDLSLESNLDDSITVDLPNSRKSSQNRSRQDTARSVLLQQSSSSYPKKQQKLKPKKNSYANILSQPKNESWQKFKREQSAIYGKQIKDSQLDFIPLSNKLQTYPNSNPYVKISQFGQKKQNSLNHIPEMALQVYQQCVIPTMLKKNEKGKSNLLGKEKNGKQLLAVLLSNPRKLQRYMHYLLQQLLLYKEQSNNESAEENNNHRQQLENVNNIYQSKKKKDGKAKQVIELLGCLLSKIRQSSLKCQQKVPSVFINKAGDIQFDFGFKSQSLTNLSKTNAQKNESLVSRRNKQRVRQLNDKLNEQDTLIQQIKHQYDWIINNYATTIFNLYYNQGDFNPHKKSNKTEENRKDPKKVIKVQEMSQEDEDQRAKKKFMDLIKKKSHKDSHAMSRRRSKQGKNMQKLGHLNLNFEDEL